MPKERQILIIQPDGTQEVREMPGKLDLKTAQDLVGGPVERVPVRWRPYVAALVNEVGLVVRLPPNPSASFAAGEPLVGPVVFVTAGLGW